MTPAEQADAHDRNFVAAISLLAAKAAAGSTDQVGTIPIAITGLAGAFFNAGWVVEPPLPTDLREAIAVLRGSGLPFTLHVRTDLPDVIAEASAFGLTDEGRLPCFAIQPGPIPPAPLGLAIDRVDLRRWEAFLDVTAEGFGLPRAVVDALYPPSLLDDGRVRAFAGSVEGREVATAVSVRTGTTIGIYSVSTVPDARGRGFGTATTWHLLADADPGWEVAVLQASEMGRPVYERMGFSLVREFVEFVGPSPG
jgi:ribosomal protein S18 acetylase RimI-like enzyme